MTYIIVIYKKYGKMKTISDSYYKLKEKNKWLFTIIWWAFSIPLIIVGETPLIFLAGTGICFVGAAPAFKEELEEKVHIVGAITGIISGVASLWFDFGLWYLSIGLFLLSLILFLNKKLYNPTWWIEFFSFCTIITGLFIKIIK
jgi:hypothetical protein